MKTRSFSIAVVAVFAVMFAALVYEAKSKATPVPVSAPAPVAAYNCTAGPGEMCASQQFLDDIDRANTLASEVISLTRSNAPLLTVQAKQDQLRGMSERLTDELRATVGPNKETVARWDDKKRVLILNPAPTAMPAPKPFAVAPPAKKP
jgi:hypothetical protein